jgi:hypothetical protein
MLTLSLLDFLVLAGLLLVMGGPTAFFLWKVKTNDLHHLDLKLDGIEQTITASLASIERRLDEHIREHEERR